VCGAADDAQGNTLGTIHTRTDGHEFLAVASSIPIHSIRIVPDVRIDPDYTLDDFLFTPPAGGN
jgi:hypothetical protein